MLRIENVGGGPLCGVPVQCSQVGQDHGPLEKAARTQVRLDPHNTHMQRGGSPPGSHTKADSTLNSLSLPSPLPLSPAPRTLLFAMGQLTMMDWNCLLGILPGEV